MRLIHKIRYLIDKDYKNTYDNRLRKQQYKKKIKHQIDLISADL